MLGFGGRLIQRVNSRESSYNVVVSADKSDAGANDYKVAHSQIASLVADVFSNTAVAENKVVEVFTDPKTPSKSVEELLGVIPVDGRKKLYAESLAKAKAEEEAIIAAEKARKAAEASKKLEEAVKKLSDKEAKASKLAEEAQEKANAAVASMDNLFSRAKRTLVHLYLGGISVSRLQLQFKRQQMRKFI